MHDVDINYIQEKLNLRFNKYIVRAVFEEKNINEDSQEIQEILETLKISYSSIKRWIREGYDELSDKKYSFNVPRDEKQLLKLAGFLDIDPVILFSINYEGLSEFIKSMEGNIFMGKNLKLGKIHKNLTFLYKIFSPCQEYPNQELLDTWNTLRKNKTNWYIKEFTSTLHPDQREIEKAIRIKPYKENPRQVFHLAYRRIKPIKSFEFWQEYKVVRIQPETDYSEIYDSNYQKRIAMIFNILGGHKQIEINKNTDFLIKTRFQEPETKFRIASLHDFEIDFEDVSKENYPSVFEYPC